MRLTYSELVIAFSGQVLDPKTERATPSMVFSARRQSFIVGSGSITEESWTPRSNSIIFAAIETASTWIISSLSQDKKMFFGGLAQLQSMPGRLIVSMGMSTPPRTRTRTRATVVDAKSAVANVYELAGLA